MRFCINSRYEEKNCNVMSAFSQTSFVSVSDAFVVAQPKLRFGGNSKYQAKILIFRPFSLNLVLLA